MTHAELPLAGSHTCACGDAHSHELPELDARAIPHAIRHASIFGALDSVTSGGGLVLVAPHDPLPLLDQMRERFGERVEVAYQHREPGAIIVDFIVRDA